MIRAPRSSATPNAPVERPAPDDLWVARFGRTERFAHWWIVAMMVVALLSGLGLGDEGHGSLLTVHIGSVIGMGAGLLLAAVVGDHRALARAGRSLFTLDHRDVAWVRAKVRHPFSPDLHREWGMFNTGQKVMAWAVTLSLAAVIVTGLMARSANEGDGGAHGTAVAVLAVLLGAHIFMATLNPPTRHALVGMVFGRVRRSWAERHHGAWLRDLDLHKR